MVFMNDTMMDLYLSSQNRKNGGLIQNEKIDADSDSDPDDDEGIGNDSPPENMG
jgi:hypothetical protein